MTSHRRRIGTIFPHEFENKCCEDKPFLLMVTFDDEGNTCYSCECECGLWCTTAYNNPAQAIMEYEMMCRVYPAQVRFNDPGLIRKYLKCYTRENGQKQHGNRNSGRSVKP